MASSLCLGAGASADESVDGSAKKDERTTRYYLGVFTAGSWATADLSRTPGSSGKVDDSSFFWGADLGVEFPIARVLDLRLELEGTNERKFDFATPGGAAGDRSEIKAWTFQGNFWFVLPLKNFWPDMPVVNRISPLGGGGVGLSQITFRTLDGGVGGSNGHTKFAWQGGVGASFEITRWLSLDARYQYADLGGASATLRDAGGVPVGELEFDLGANEFLAGLRFVF